MDGPSPPPPSSLRWLELPVSTAAADDLPSLVATSLLTGRGRVGMPSTPPEVPIGEDLMTMEAAREWRPRLDRYGWPAVVWGVEMVLSLGGRPGSKIKEES